MTKPTWIICGNYGAGNLGDEAVLRGLLNLWGTEKNLIVMSVNPIQTHQEFGVKTINRLPSGLRSRLKAWFIPKYRAELNKTKEAISNCDRFILGGGTLLTDEPRASMFVWGKQLKAAFKYGKKVEFYANGIGPLNSKWAKKWAKSLLQRAQALSVRDNLSLEWLDSLGIKGAQLVKDPALHLTLNPTKATKEFPKNTIILAPRFWEKHHNQTTESLKKFVQYLCVEQGKYMVGIPFEKNNKKDTDLLSKIFDQEGVRNSSEIWKDYKNENEVLETMAQAEMVIGMRLHSLLFAHLAATPFIGLAYMEKVVALAKDLDPENPIISLDNLSYENLKRAYLSCAPKVSS